MKERWRVLWYYLKIWHCDKEILQLIVTEWRSFLQPWEDWGNKIIIAEVSARFTDVPHKDSPDWNSSSWGWTTSTVADSCCFPPQLESLLASSALDSSFTLISIWDSSPLLWGSSFTAAFGLTGVSLSSACLSASSALSLLESASSKSMTSSELTSFESEAFDCFKSASAWRSLNALL